jgi:hypothetical protein
VKPERDQNNRETYRKNWWIWGEPRKEWRKAKNGLARYIATTRTARHRIFQFLPSNVISESKVVGVACEDAFMLGVLSSREHLVFALVTGGWLGVGNDPTYNHSECFDPFPFPDATETQKERIRDLAERLDAHRKAVLGKHKHLTMTGLYNVLEKLRTGAALSEAEKDVYDAGLVGVLKQLHDDLDAAVADAYGWPADLADEQILERLVALNHERAAEEREGKVRWLRPEFQAPKETPAARPAQQIEADLLVAGDKAKKPALPAELPDQVAAVRAMLERAEGPVSAADLARRFAQGKRAERRVADVLRTLALLGQAERAGDGFVLSE